MKNETAMRLFDKAGFIEIMGKNNDTQMKLARALGIDVCTLNRKINWRSHWTVGELQIIRARYKLNSQQMEAVFFRKEATLC